QEEQEHPGGDVHGADFARRLPRFEELGALGQERDHHRRGQERGEDAGGGAEDEQYAPVVLEPRDEGRVEGGERDVLGRKELDGVVEVRELAPGGGEKRVPQGGGGEEGSDEREGRR